MLADYLGAYPVGKTTLDVKHLEATRHNALQYYLEAKVLSCLECTSSWTVLQPFTVPLKWQELESAPQCQSGHFSRACCPGDYGQGACAFFRCLQCRHAAKNGLHKKDYRWEGGRKRVPLAS